METLKLYKALPGMEDDGSNHIIRYRTRAGHLWLVVEELDAALIGIRREPTHWHVMLYGHPTTTWLYVTSISHALAIPFVMADMLDLLQVLPTDIIPSAYNWDLIKPQIVTLNHAYDCNADITMDSLPEHSIGKRNLIHRAMNYPRKLEEKQNGNAEAT